MAGPDGVQAELFKNVYHEIQTAEGYVKHDYRLARELSFVFQHVFSSGSIPDVWCSAVLCSVFKKVIPLTLTIIEASR
jgi:hypothetical protein